MVTISKPSLLGYVGNSIYRITHFLLFYKIRTISFEISCHIIDIRYNYNFNQWSVSTLTQIINLSANTYAAYIYRFSHR